MKKFAFFLPLLVLLVLATCKSPTNVVPSDKAMLLGVNVYDANNNLVEGTLSVAESGGPNHYVLTLDLNMDLFSTITLIPQVSPGASTTPERLEIPDDPNNSITFTIVSEDESTRTVYSLKIKSQFLGTKANFLDVAVYDADNNLVGSNLKSVLGINSYVLTLDPGTDLSTITLIPQVSPGASVTPKTLVGPSDHNSLITFSEDESTVPQSVFAMRTITFPIISEDESKNVKYQLKIESRVLFTEARFLALKVYDAENELVESPLTETGDRAYGFTLNPGTDLSNLTLIPVVSPGALGPEELEMPDNLNTPIRFDVTSEDKEITITYSLKASKIFGKEAKLLDVEVYDADDNLVEGTTREKSSDGSDEYLLTLNPGTDPANVSLIPKVSPGASIKPETLVVPDDLDTSIIFDVISEDEETTITYSLKVSKTFGAEANFLDVEVYDADDNLVEGTTLEESSDGSDEYLLTLNPGTDPANVSLIPKVSPGASIKPETLVVPDDLDTSIIFDVISEDEETTITYSLKVSKTFGAEANFLDVEVYDADDNLVEGTTLEESSDGSDEYLLTLNPGTDPANVSLIPKVSPGASIKPETLVVPDDLDTSIIFDVISEDEETTITYSLKVSKTFGTKARFLDVEVYDENNKLVDNNLSKTNSGIRAYLLTLSPGTDPANVSLIPKISPGASIKPETLVVPDDLDTLIIFDVISEDEKTTLSYKLQVSKNFGTEANFLDVEVYDADDNLVEGTTLAMAPMRISSP